MNKTVLLAFLVGSGHFIGMEPSAAGESPRWTGQGRCRVLVQVEPVDIGKRESDELVAQYPIDFVAILKEQKIAGETDLSTLQVHQYNPDTGEAEKFKPFATAISPFDRPCRFEDDAVPSDYPDRANYASDYPRGKGPITWKRKRGGRLFNREMENTHGKITWVHTQSGRSPSYYSIYWDVKASAAECGPSPAPWIGDADVYRLKEGQLLSGQAHFTACVGDYNGDGLFDLFGSVEKGDLMWFPNRGTPGHPKFVGCRMLMDEDGPIDLGWYGAPFMFDWDNDGLPDVLAGTSHNAILWWKNVGARKTPKLSYRGFVQADGHRLEVPEQPVPEDSSNSFKNDYYNQPWVGDWDGDSVPDILTGGYTTGLVFSYHGAGRGPDGVPELHYVGPLEEDGQTLDTTWAAAPLACDVDDDGKKDLITGSWFWSGIPRAPRPGEVEYLMYYHNVGQPGKPELHREPLPRIGEFPQGDIARPSAVDWNEDGLIDLLVSDGGGSVYCFLNKGKPAAPRWEMSHSPLRTQWGFVRDFGFTSSAVMAPDGVLDLLSGEQFAAYEGSAYSPRIVRRGAARVNGQVIHYPGPGYGDAYSFTALADWDHDGHPDLLWGTQQGNIYLHRNMAAKDPYAFAPGVKLKLNNGEDLRVGPPVFSASEKLTDFTVLQGSRVIMCASDFDGDGIDDLAITETYGNLWIFRNTRAGGTDTFEPGVKVGKVVGGGRSDDLNFLDWNEDGKPDLIVGQTSAKPGAIYINKSTPGHPAFADPIQPLDVPFLFWGASFKPVDWNHDGDEDFLVCSEFYTFYIEKSFLQHGYRRASVIGAPQHREHGGGS